MERELGYEADGGESVGAVESEETSEEGGEKERHAGEKPWEEKEGGERESELAHEIFIYIKASEDS